MNKIICEICGSEYVHDETNPSKAYLSFLAHLRSQHGLNRKKYINSGYSIPADIELASKQAISQKNKELARNVDLVEEKNEKLRKKIGDDEFNRYPKCKICGFVARQLFKHITTIHNIDMPSYHSTYPDAIVALPEYYEYLSSSRTGENNPQFNNGKSEFSPFSSEFYLRQGYTLEESVKLAEDKKKQVKEKMTPEKQATRPEYYMKRDGVDYAKALNLVTDRQRTNTVDAIAARHGISKEDAKVIRDDITKKWCDTMSKKPIDELIEINRKKMSHNAVSKISMIFINHVLKFCEINPDEALFNEREVTIVVPTNTNMFGHRCVMYDFCYKNKIIEFNGNDVHANPSIYVSTDKPIHKFNSKSHLTAQQIWDYDAEKMKIANDNGYDVMVVWELEWKSDKSDVLNRAKEFLLGTK